MTLLSPAASALMAAVMAFIGREIARPTSQAISDAKITDRMLLPITTAVVWAPVRAPTSVQWSDQTLISSRSLSNFCVKAPIRHELAAD